MVETARRQQRPLLAGGREELRGLLGTDDSKRVRLEGDENAPTAPFLGLLDDSADDSLVTQVHAVEGPHRDDDGAIVPREFAEGVRETGHGAKTLRGRNRPSLTAPTATSPRSGDKNAARTASGAEEDTRLPMARSRASSELTVTCGK